MQIKWNDRLSSPFGMRNGLRQGSVLSPSLFNIYIDDLLRELEQGGDGARIGSKYVGALAYADDITLLSPTVLGIQRMLNTCAAYAEDHNLLFNEKKSTSIVFVKCKRSYIRYPELRLSAIILPYIQSMAHLGTILQLGQTVEQWRTDVRSSIVLLMPQL